MKPASLLVIATVATLIAGSVFLFLRSAALDKDANWRIAGRYWTYHELSANSTVADAPLAEPAAPSSPSVPLLVLAAPIKTAAAASPIISSPTAPATGRYPSSGPLVADREPIPMSAPIEPSLEQSFQVLMASLINLEMKAGITPPPAPN